MRIMAVSHPCVTDVNQQFYAELEALGHEIQLIVPANFRTAYAAGGVKVSRWKEFGGGIEERKVGLASSIPLHFYQSDLRPSLVRYRPDVLFVEEEPYALSAWQAFFASRGLPLKRVVYSAQNIYKSYPPPFRWMERYVLERADAAAVVSDEVGAVLRRKSFAGSLISFPLGVDTKQFRPLPPERAAIRREVGAQDDEFIVGYVGRFVAEKGIHTLLAALPLLNKHQIKLLFVGKGPLMADIQAAQGAYPDMVRIADRVQHRDMQRYMNAFDALALPSITMPNWKEQFGRVIIEAMACRVPVIGSDSGEIPKLIRLTGGGWTFPEGNAERLAELVLQLAKHPDERLQKAETGYASVLELFSKMSLARRFEREMLRLQGHDQIKREAK